MLITTVHDKCVNMYGVPVVVRNDADGIRMFSDEIMRDGSVFGQHPEHYDLYAVGMFDDETGLVVGCTPRLLVAGSVAAAARSTASS